MTAFKPAQPNITPTEQVNSALTPPVVAPVPQAGVQLVGVPSKSPPPHVNHPRPVPAKPVVREYAWQRRLALGKSI